MSGYIVREVVEGDLDDIALLYAKTFIENPAYSYIFDDSNKYDGLLWLFRKRAQIILDCGASFLCITTAVESQDKSSQRIIGAVGCTELSKKPSLWQLVFKYGLLAWPILWGYASLTRALDLDGKLSHGGDIEIDFQLNMMAIDPVYQGKGYGKILLSALLNNIRMLVKDKNDSKVRKVVLDTQKEKNLSFYSYFGFQLTGKSDLLGFTSWNMALTIV